MNRTELRGVIFDMDGVLLDNVEYHLEAFRLFGEEQGRELTRSDVFKVFGRKNSDMLQALLDRALTAEEVAFYGGRKEQIYRELIAPHLEATVVGGLPCFLQDLGRNEIPCAIATSGPIENVVFVLDGLGLRRWFRTWVTGEEVRLGKPHPEAFLTAACKLGLRSTECVVFEDSFSGIQAAQNANSKCVAVATTHSSEELREARADLIIEDFRGLDWASLRKTLLEEVC